MDILILFNEITDTNREDQNDLLIQVDFVSSILKRQGHKIKQLTCGLDLDKLTTQLQKKRPDLVVNLVEELNNYSQFANFIPALLENLRIPFTGASATAMCLTNNKIFAKRILRQNRLLTPDWFVPNDQNNPFSSGRKYIIKAVHEHASFAINEYSVDNFKSAVELTKAIESMEARYKCSFFAEQYIQGREFNVALVANGNKPEILPISEIKFVDFNERAKILTYKAKWQETSLEYLNTVRTFKFSRHDHGLITRLKQLSLRVWDIMNLCGYARIDFRIDKRNNPFILEINVNPCFAPDSGFIVAAQLKYKSLDIVIKKILGL